MRLQREQIETLFSPGAPSEVAQRQPIDVVQRAFWHLEPGAKKVSDEQKATVERLGSNDQFKEEAQGLDQIDNSFSLESANEPPTGITDLQEDLYVMAHGSQTGAGRDEDKPWIGGMEFGPFAQLLNKRYGGVVKGKTIWLMTCLVGGVLNDLAQQCAQAGLRDTTILAPRSFMFVSDRGIPHVYDPNADSPDVDELNKRVARADANYFTLSAENYNWLSTGLGWAGIKIDAQGTVTVMEDKYVIKAVLDKFDISEEEWNASGLSYEAVLPLFG